MFETVSMDHTYSSVFYWLHSTLYQIYYNENTMTSLLFREKCIIL